MSRIVSIWLKAWPIARLLRAKGFAASADPPDPYRPLVLVAPGKGGARILACNKAARRQGLTVGELLSNARSKVLDLQTRDANAAADAMALRQLALWALRYTPKVAAWDEASGGDGLFLDITGCAHLFGGEKCLLGDIAQRLRRFGLAARMAVADTAGASWAVARYGAGDRGIVAPGVQAEVLRDLPLAALRFSDAALSLLRRLGMRRVAEMMSQPRAPFAARFDGDLLLRLDQALGTAPEPLVPVVPPPIYHAQTMFLEPITSEEHVLEAARHLLRQVVPQLETDDAGARTLRLLLFKVDGGVVGLDLGLAAPSRDVEHILSLMALRLERKASGFDAEFGFEAAAMHVVTADRLNARQSGLHIGGVDGQPEALAQLIDRLRQRLGPDAVRQLRPRQSHIPERAEHSSSAEPNWDRTKAISGGPSNTPEAARPLLLLAKPEATQVIASVPDGPPRQFRWRGVTHQVLDAEGPERITPEWWRRAEANERDYYMVEDTEGHRFWLYRDGLYGGEAAPQWFVHGVFA
jgi:protein ImuB